MGHRSRLEPLSSRCPPAGGRGMKTVNLLPAWYVQQQRQSKNLRVHLGIMILLGVGMFAATVGARERIAVLSFRRDALARHVAQDGDPDQELQARQTELKRLENLQLAYRELGN